MCDVRSQSGTAFFILLSNAFCYVFRYVFHRQNPVIAMYLSFYFFKYHTITDDVLYIPLINTSLYIYSGELTQSPRVDHLCYLFQSTA